MRRTFKLYVRITVETLLANILEQDNSKPEEKGTEVQTLKVGINKTASTASLIKNENNPSNKALPIKVAFTRNSKLILNESSPLLKLRAASKSPKKELNLNNSKLKDISPKKISLNNETKEKTLLNKLTKPISHTQSLSATNNPSTKIKKPSSLMSPTSVKEPKKRKILDYLTEVEELVTETEGNYFGLDIENLIIKNMQAKLNSLVGIITSFKIQSKELINKTMRLKEKNDELKDKNHKLRERMQRLMNEANNSNMTIFSPTMKFVKSHPGCIGFNEI